MADLATPEFLSSLKATYPPETPNSPHLWAIVAAVGFGASNVPEAVPAVFTYALQDLIRSQHATGISGDVAQEEQLLLARKIREAVLQSGLLSGMPRVRVISSSLSLTSCRPSSEMGAPFLICRKVDARVEYSTYELSVKLRSMFSSCFTSAQRGSARK